MIKNLLFIMMVFIVQKGVSQVGYGTVFTWGTYDKYVNPIDDYSPSAGNAVLNLGIGPKLWLGNKDISISVEAIAHIGFTGYSKDEYKGMGMIAFPILAKLNFAGLSSFNSKGKMGISLGGGIQYNKTELYGLDDEHSDINRDLFPTYVGEVGIGFGLNGAVFTGFYRFGSHPDNAAKTHNIGILLDMNWASLKKIERVESKLF